jgi:deferrochelatase/peroxidase EfeB
MVSGPVTPKPPAPSWKLEPAVAGKTQGIAVAGFGGLPNGRALILQFKWSQGAAPKGWLTRLRAVAPITVAMPPADLDSQPRAATLAFTATGLALAGLPLDALDTFSRPFREGMYQQDRLRRIGDRRNGKWLETVIADGPIWGGNARPTPLPLRSNQAYVVPHDGPPDEVIDTKLTAHALLLLYARSNEEADAWTVEVTKSLTVDNIDVVRCRELVLDVEGEDKFSREHFGFADALSQPQPYDAKGAVLVDGKPSKQPDPVQGVPLGDFLIGYVDNHQDIPPVPVVVDSEAGRAAGLEPSDNAAGFLDFGVNGSYLVVRELKQDVAAFWNSMKKNAEALAARDPQNADTYTGDWLAARCIGRDRDGHLLLPGNERLPVCSDGSPDSAFLFFDKDQHGTGCPVGSHVRRAFPRDGLAPTPGDKQTLLQAANNHRILRRGRKYGTKIADRETADDKDRGLLFICLNTDIERQFEFLQQTWLLNSSFGTLYEETDPLVGPKGCMTIREGSVRLMAHVDTFVKLVGGDYFFLPSIPALSYLEQL